MSVKEIDQCDLSARRKSIVSGYPDRWRETIHAWKAPRSDRTVQLMYSANYLCNTHGIRWAVDPLLLSSWIPEAEKVHVGSDLNDLNFVLLTHRHGDHVDMDLWSQLQESRCHWIVPEHMVDFFSDKVSIGNCNLSVAVSGTDIEIAGAAITPFDSCHHERLASGEMNHVPSTGYCVRATGRSYLLPGDIRTYDPACIEAFTDVSVVFAHVFLGRAAALDPNPPLLDAFVDFYLSCRPEKIILTHINELSRGPHDRWLESHASAVAKAFVAAAPDVEIVTPAWYEETAL